MFILRWPVVLVLLAYFLMCAAGALGLGASLLGLDLDNDVWRDFLASAQGADWRETALLAAAAVFLFIAAVRLMRRTQGFLTWLLGFACLVGRYALVTLAQDDNIIADAAAVSDLEEATKVAAAAINDYPLVFLAILFICGVIILFVDTADRAYWRKRGA